MAQEARAFIAGELIPRNYIPAVKVLVWAACLAPFAFVLAKILGIASLGPNPVEEVLHSMGKTSLNLLWITLAITPLRKLTKQNWLIRFRRLLGLFSFFYLILHMLTYAALDRRFDWDSLLVDVTERPYITAGMLALVLMIPLAVTSTKGWQRRLGRRWTKLHRLVYVIAVLGAVHLWWQTKADMSEPALYAAMLAALLGYRLIDYRARTRRAAAARERFEQAQ
jgi:sulfoxide reductase heme-binding subunit YedZ